MYEATYPMNFTDEDLKAGRVDSKGILTFKPPVFFNAKITKASNENPTIEFIDCSISDVLDAGIDACLNVDVQPDIWGFTTIRLSNPYYNDSDGSPELNFDKVFLDQSDVSHVHINVYLFVDYSGTPTAALTVKTLAEPAVTG